MRIEFCPEVPCLGADCPRLKRWDGHRSMGMSLDSALYDRAIVRHVFAQELGLSCASDEAGFKHQCPADAEFEIHTVRRDNGTVWYTAIYSGETPPEELLAREPEWDAKRATELSRQAVKALS